MLDKLKMLKQAHDIQKKLNDITITEECEGTKVTINGKQEIVAIYLNETFVENQDKANLERTIKTAFNNAVRKSQIEIAQKMQADFGGLSGLLGM